MLISKNKEPLLVDFKKLVYAATQLLNDDAKAREAYYATRNGQKFRR